MMFRLFLTGLSECKKQSFKSGNVSGLYFVLFKKIYSLFYGP